MQSKRRQVEELIARPYPGKQVSIVKLQMVKEGSTLYDMDRFGSPAEVVRLVRPLIEYADREMLLVMSLNIRLMPMALEVVAVGSVGSCYVEMRELFKHAILNNATSIICFHNHPSGNPAPSRGDRDLTNRIAKCGILLGIALTDHIILGENGSYFSFAETGLIEKNTEGEAA